MFQKAYERLRAAQAARLKAAGSEGAEVEGSAEAGFTLIELMVVLLIMGILMAIAIPTFLGVTASAHDKSAQSNLVNALTTAKAYQAANQSYSTTTIGLAAVLQTSEPSLKWTGQNTNAPVSTNGITTATNGVSEMWGTLGNTIVLASPSPSDNGCWAIVDTSSTSGPTGEFDGDTTATPTIWGPGSTTVKPSSAGTFYGVFKTSTTLGCSAYNALANVTSWGHKFPGVV